MSPTSRRIFLYWLLLLVPTLVVGGTAILLLQREQARLAERSASADAARRAAIAARARLVVENVELIASEVESGLLDTLAAEPAAGIDRFLERWEESNPLVRTAFRATAKGQLLRPDPRATGEAGGDFARRFLQQFGERPPWSDVPQAAPAVVEKKERDRLAEESTARQDVGRNVAQVQSARRDVQELLRAPAAPRSAAPVPMEATAAADFAAGGTVGDNVARSRVADYSGRPSASARPLRGEAAAGEAEKALALAAKAVPAAEADSARSPSAAARRGWSSAVVDGQVQLVGWVQPGVGGEVWGVELDLAALVSRLGGTLPVEVAAGEGYALRDAQGRGRHQVGTLSLDGAPFVRVPLATALLPGWDVAAFLEPGAAGGTGGAGVWGVAVLLVGMLVAAILAGGSLLLRQARRSEEEAVQKTSFVANVSHEFKTPLTTIRLYSELLEQGRVRDAAQGASYLRIIGRETERLARLVNNALDFSRLEQGRKKFAREEIDVGAELDRLLETHAPRLAESGLTLHRERPISPLRVTTDRDALEQIVLNLIDNAAKYAAAGGEVTVAVGARTGGGVEVRVSDRGPGVPAGHRERIFQKFHRVDDALTAEKTGAGLGLSIARQLARGLGGDLTYAPRAGGGATFVVELP